MWTFKSFLLCIVMWLGVVAAFAGLAFWSCGSCSWGFSWDIAREGAVLWGCLGVGVATLVAVGTLMIRNVRARSLDKGWAVLVVLVSSVVSAVAPPLLMLRLCDLSGDGGWWIIIMPLLSTASSALGLLILLVCIGLTRTTMGPNKPVQATAG